MEAEEGVQQQPCKRSRVGNGAKIGQQDEDEADGEAMGGAAQLRPWHHSHHAASSRIFRVSRASGGKDRHSKVLTAKGLRDRRVRLSVSTAIQFYDLQDRLGLDQPSKAVEWLINAASAAIANLPALDGPFPDPPSDPPLPSKNKLQADEPMPDPDPDPDADPGYNHHHQQHLSLTKSGCSSTSDTSKGSVLSLSRSECRAKARERARERAARDKEKERDNISVAAHHHAVNPSLNSPSSFTELLTGGSGGGNGTAVRDSSSPNCIHKQHRHPPPATVTADYFGQAGIFAQAHVPKPHHLPPFSSQPHFLNSSTMAMLPFGLAAGTADHPEMQQISFMQMQDQVIPVAAVAPPGDYNLNFSISSSGLAGLNRGTLQSNSAPQLPHHQLHRLSPPVDGSNLPFFFGAAAANPAENQFPAGFDARLQLYYGDFKGKGKS